MEEKQVIERIKALCAARRWSAYRLAKESGITYSTLCTMLNKSNTPSIPTLMKLCDGLGITLSEFFSEDSDILYLPPEDKAHLQRWNRLSKENQSVVWKYVDFLLSQQGDGN